MSAAWICICRCAAVCRLEKFKDLIIPHLQIGPSRLPDLCCQRSLDHFVTICLGLHLQAQLKSGVGPDLRIYHTAWLLGCQDQMYTKASSDTGSTDQLFHKVRLLFFQFSKLVYDNDQMWKWCLGTSLTV